MKVPANLKGTRIAILVADGFEQVEMTEPRKALDMCGATTHIISPNKDTVKGWNQIEWGETFEVNVPLEQARACYYDALLLPGGVMNPDTLRINARAVEFVRSFFLNQKPVAALCHSLHLLIEADVVRDRTLTSYPSLRKDLENAGARWVDREVVVDQGLVSSRKPDDIPAFNEKMIKEIAEGINCRQHA
ncbi:type 1 glutamine amidotransferase domain-containing protein [Telluribacter humicola]|uniref:type 1 glutamine amidotransferase domain-containing protein n=1 Tax=Telluribacter humicola TaxID=1720261 RepID=UPI001A9669BE|nr:type 1 glutamine amidotransferase domain-containing protein [Telluribacter humicola]